MTCTRTTIFYAATVLFHVTEKKIDSIELLGLNIPKAIYDKTSYINRMHVF